MVNIIQSDNPEINISGVEYSNKLKNLSFAKIPQFISGGEQYQEIYFDCKFNTTSPGQFTSNYQISVDFDSDEDESLNKVWGSSDPNVSSIDQSGYVSNLSSGSCDLFVKTRYGKYGKNINFSVENLPRKRILIGFKEGTASNSVNSGTFNQMQSSYELPINIQYDPILWNGIDESDVVFTNGFPTNRNPNKVYVFTARFSPPSPQRDRIIYYNPLNNSFYLAEYNSRFIIQNDRDGYYKKNPFFWGRNYDFSGITVQVSTSDSITLRTKTGTLVTKRHMVHVSHAGYTPSIGTVVKFVDNNNVIHERTVIDRVSFNDKDFGATLLNEDVPENIKTYKLLPSNYLEYFPRINRDAYFILKDGTEKSVNNGVFSNLLSIKFDQDKSANISLVKFITTSIWTSGDWPIIYNGHVEINDTTFIGDSGSPRFFSINNDLVLYGLAESYSLDTFFTKDFVSNRISSINPMGYETKEVDLSIFDKIG
jgi:hypothetical protein